MARLLGIGAGLLDRLAHVPEQFLDSIDGAKGGMELIEFPRMQDILDRLPQPPVQAPGGSAANTVMAFARLGGSAGILAKIGDDQTGDFYLRQFRAAGVDTAACKQIDDIPTGSCLSLITPDSQRTMRTFLGASATMRPEEITAEDLRGYSHLHLEGYLLFNRELLTQILRRARQANCQVSLDLGAPEVVDGARDLLPDLLHQYVDMVFANQDEAMAYCGNRNPEAGLRKLAEVCPLAAVKLGADGALLRRADEMQRIPARRATAVDTTGAGDLWAAGFLYGVVNHFPLAQAGALGARLGAEVVQTTGAVLAEQTWKQIRRDFKLDPDFAK